MFDLFFYEQLKRKYIHDKDNKSLDRVRIYLDSCDMKMSKPKYKFDIKNLDTWKYLDSKIGEKGKDIIVTEVLNSRFKYGHL